MSDTDEGQWVGDEDALADLCERLVEGAEVGFDTEFHGERTYVPMLTLVQVALGGTVYLVDPLALDLTPLLQRLAEARVVVVGHALDGDMRALTLAGLPLPTRVFDTQLVAGFCGHDPQMGLASLLNRRLGVELDKSQRTSDWTRRPLGGPQRRYAVQDVAHLLSLAGQLRAEAEEQGRADWVAQENARLVLRDRYEAEPERAWKKVKGAGKLNGRERAVLQALAVTRLAIARSDDIPLRQVVPDDILLGLAQRPPRKEEDLLENRRIRAHFVKRHGRAIIEAASSGRDAPPMDAARVPTPSRDDAEVVALLQIVLGRLGRVQQLAATHILNKAGLHAAVRARPEDLAAFCAAAGLDGWRAELAGPALYDVYAGRVSLSVDPGPQPRIRETGHPPIK